VLVIDSPSSLDNSNLMASTLIDYDARKIMRASWFETCKSESCSFFRRGLDSLGRLSFLDDLPPFLSLIVVSVDEELRRGSHVQQVET